MAISQERKNELISEFKTHDNDTGSPEVQVAILTDKLQPLTIICVNIIKITILAVV